VVLIHGNVVSLEDFEASGVVDALSRTHRVISFDRPGFGHSTRPRDRVWDPAAQGAALQAALDRIGVERPVLVGHSMGTLVAMAMALDRPDRIGGVVLLGGYHYPTARIDAMLMGPVALPVLGDVLRYTVTALTSRAMIGRVARKMFAPNEVPADFFDFVSSEMMVRPVQIRANAEDAALMIPSAADLAKRYGDLKVPLALIAGTDDAVIDPEAHAERLHAELPASRLFLVPGSGHMVHHIAPRTVVEAVRAVEAGAPSGNRPDSLSSAAPQAVAMGL
jgi:pimeloyl-ACP methyl ester carboxylesterase